MAGKRKDGAFGNEPIRRQAMKPKGKTSKGKHGPADTESPDLVAGHGKEIGRTMDARAHKSHPTVAKFAKAHGKSRGSQKVEDRRLEPQHIKRMPNKGKK